MTKPNHDRGSIRELPTGLWRFACSCGYSMDVVSRGDCEFLAIAHGSPHARVYIPKVT